MPRYKVKHYYEYSVTIEVYAENPEEAINKTAKAAELESELDYVGESGVEVYNSSNELIYET